MTTTELFFDVETTTKNKGHPFTPENKLVSYAISSDNSVEFVYHSDPGFIGNLGSKVQRASSMVGFNLKFDLHWADRVDVDFSDVKIWDCSLAEFVLSGQQDSFISLNEVLTRYGLPTKPDVVADYWKAGVDTDQIPVPILEEYNSYDVSGLPPIKELQLQQMTPQQTALVWLMGEDLKTLQAAEAAGIKFDKQNAIVQNDALSKEIIEIESSLNKYLPDLPDGATFNWDSGDQLSAFLYGGQAVYDVSFPETSIYKSGPKKGESYTRNRWSSHKVTFDQRFKPLPNSEVKKSKDNPDPARNKQYKVDAPTLKALTSRRKEDRQILDLLAQRAEKIKVVEMVNSILEKFEVMGWQDDFIHGQFNQNVVVTGRLSSSGPNLQNTPPEIDKLLVSRYDN